MLSHLLHGDTPRGRLRKFSAGNNPLSMRVSGFCHMSRSTGPDTYRAGRRCDIWAGLFARWRDASIRPEDICDRVDEYFRAASPVKVDTVLEQADLTIPEP